ncbi:hypothetical protein [Modicisalibacter coralii]|uniref:hypothetical protein n=1 Tax=Modicisalibacter coralii TaxID=2304602 RepID=UPI003CC615EA
MTPNVPPHLLTPLPAPPLTNESNGGLLDLLAAYESLRRRANADRLGVSQILQRMDDDDAE